MLQLQIFAVAHVCASAILSLLLLHGILFLSDGLSGFLKVFVSAAFNALVFGLGFCPKPTKQTKKRTHTHYTTRAKKLCQMIRTTLSVLNFFERKKEASQKKKSQYKTVVLRCE